MRSGAHIFAKKREIRLTGKGVCNKINQTIQKERHNGIFMKSTAFIFGYAFYFGGYYFSDYRPVCAV